MKTRAQMRREAFEKQEQSSKPKPTKKEALEKKRKRQKEAEASHGEPEGSKKIKKDQVKPTAKPVAGRKRVVRVTEQKPAKSDQKSTKNEKPESVTRRQSQRKRPSAKDPSIDGKGQKQDKSLSKKDQRSVSKEKAGGKKIDQPEDKQEIKKFKMKGKVPVDQHFTHARNPDFQVLEHGGKVYSCTLNQTSVQNNNNKFYILQILQDSKNPQNCYFFTRWGRVGVPGSVGCSSAIPMSSAISQYNSKYHDKYHKGNYREVQLNYQNEEEEDNKQQQQKKTNGDKQKEFQQSKLSKPVRRLVELIFDINMMNKQMLEIGYNVSKMPLGKLSKENIKLGFSILQKLMDQLKGKNKRSVIEDLTNDFYSYIPHDFGFAKMSQFVLDDVSKVKKKIEMLESLAEIKVATSLLSSDAEDVNRLDSNYKKLNRDIRAIERDSKTFEIIDKYLQTTHARTHGGYILQLQDLFSLSSEVEDVRYTKEIGNKMLLWHGSRLTNFVGILSQGLRIAPPEAPVTGYMFGKGVYFADMSSKSANYCFTSRQNSTGILLLCEVALGEMNQKLHADYYASNLPPGKNSTKGVGRTAPRPDNAVALDDGVTIPMGPGEPTGRDGATLLYNQFIVYDVAQIKIRYLLRTKFNYKNNAYGF